MKNQDKKTEIAGLLCDFEAIAADCLKNLASESQDPQLKTKYEQIAGLNRGFTEKLKNEIQQDKPPKPIDKEIKLIMRAYFIEKALYNAVCEYSVGNARPNIIDELVDRHTLILRELLTEASWREGTIQKDNK